MTYPYTLFHLMNFLHRLTQNLVNFGGIWYVLFSPKTTRVLFNFNLRGSLLIQLP